MMIDATPYEAEAMAVAALLTGQEITISSDLFLDPKHKLIVDSVYRLRQRGTEYIGAGEVIADLDSLQKLDDVGGTYYITGLINKSDLVQEPRELERVLQNAALRRKGIRALTKAQQVLADPESDPVQTIDTVSTYLSTALVTNRGEQDTYTSSQIAEMMVQDAINNMRNPRKVRGIPTGLVLLDDAISGLKPGFFGIIGAPSGGGKTSLACSMLWSIATASGKPAALFETEMRPQVTANRICCIQAEVDAHLLEQGRASWCKAEDYRKCSGVQISGRKQMCDVCRFLKVAERFAELPIILAHTPGITVESLDNRIRALKRKHGGLSVAIVDHIQRMGGYTSLKTNERFERMLPALKDTAELTDVPVIALSQFSRDVLNYEFPTIYHLYGSAYLEQNADFILLFNKGEPIIKDDETAPRKVRLDVAKNRHGPDPKQEWLFVPQYTKFKPLKDDVPY